MSYFLQAAALAMIGAILALVLQKQSKELSILLVLGCGICIYFLAVHFLEPVIDFVLELQQIGNLDGDMVRLLLKATGIGILAEVSGTICEDAGEATLGKMVRLCGSCAAMYLALPMLTAVMEMVKKLLEG